MRWFRFFAVKVSFVNYLYSVFGIVYCKLKVLKACKVLFEKGFKVLSLQDLIQVLAQRKERRGSSVCHVIGSGWSLNRSKSLIGCDDFVIGFNFAALCDLDFDCYFVEFGGEKVSDISKLHRSLVNDVVSKKTDLIFFKNLWESKNELQYIIENWGGGVSYVKDYVVPCLRPKSLGRSLEWCLDEKGEFLPQYTSTALTCIFLAYFCGFKKIVLHGVDFGGKYFYEDDGFDGVLTHAPVKRINDKFYAPSNAETIHPTALGDVGMRAALPIIAELLMERGVVLYSASENSPLSNILPGY